VGFSRGLHEWVYAKLVVLNYFMDMKRSFALYALTLNSISCLTKFFYDQ